MKLVKLLLLAGVCSIQSSLAGFNVPSSVYTLDRLDEAKTEAANSGQKLIILKTVTDSN